MAIAFLILMNALIMAVVARQPIEVAEIAQLAQISGPALLKALRTRATDSIHDRRAVNKAVYNSIRAGWNKRPDFVNGMGSHLVDDVHTGIFRSSLAAIAATVPKDAAKLPAPALTRFKALTDILHHHHSLEDVMMFPKAKKVSREVEAEVKYLEKDHAAIDGAIKSVVTAGTADAAAVPESDFGAGYAALKEFADFLDDHLTREELLIVPLMLEGKL